MPRPATSPSRSVHAEQSGLDIDYRHTTAEELALAGERFDVVLNMEVIEHVADPARLSSPPVTTCCGPAGS